MDLRNGKNALTGFLLAFVVACLGVLLAKELRGGPATGTTAAGPQSAARAAAVPPGAFRTDALRRPSQQVVAYYFHGRFRCASCVRIESLSRKATMEGFPEELRAGRLEFREVNVEEPENRHFIGDYRLVNQSLVVVEFRDGRKIRWTNLEKVWTLLGSQDEFLAYVREGIRSHLAGA